MFRVKKILFITLALAVFCTFGFSALAVTYTHPNQTLVYHNVSPIINVSNDSSATFLLQYGSHVARGKAIIGIKKGGLLSADYNYSQVGQTTNTSYVHVIAKNGNGASESSGVASASVSQKYVLWQGIEDPWWHTCGTVSGDNLTFTYGLL